MKAPTAVELVQGQSLHGKVAVVTGGNSGIGLETVKALALAGCHVVVCCRNPAAGQREADLVAAALHAAATAAAAADTAAADTAAEAAGGRSSHHMGGHAAVSPLGLEADGKGEVGHDAGPGPITVVQLDLANLSSIQACARELQELPRLDFLVLNAGIMGVPLCRTKSGMEMHMTTNHVGHFYLTQLLLPKVKAQGTPARIVSISSISHTFCRSLPLDDLNWERRKYSPVQAYAQSKLANILFASELARRLQREGAPQVKAYAAHPGLIPSTNISHHAAESTGWWGACATACFNCVMFPFTKTPAQGAATTIFGLLDSELETHSGAYLAKCALAEPSRLAQDAQLAKGLWEKTEAMLQEALARHAEQQQHAQLGKGHG